MESESSYLSIKESSQEVEGSQSSTEEEETPFDNSTEEAIIRPRKINYSRKWNKHPQLKDWVCENPKSSDERISGVYYIAYCKACETPLRASSGQHDLISHSRTEKHIRNMIFYLKQKTVKRRMPLVNDIKTEILETAPKKKKFEEICDYSSDSNISKEEKKYNIAWNKDPELKRWICENNDSDNHIYFAICKPCGLKLRANRGKIDLTTHAKTARHIGNMRIFEMDNEGNSDDDTINSVIDAMKSTIEEKHRSLIRDTRLNNCETNDLPSHSKTFPHKRNITQLEIVSELPRKETKNESNEMKNRLKNSTGILENDQLCSMNSKNDGTNTIRKIQTEKSSYELAWDSDPLFKDWILENKGLNRINIAYCKICGTSLQATEGRKDLIIHATSKKHLRNLKILQELGILLGTAAENASSEHHQCFVCLEKFENVTSINQIEQGISIREKISLCTGVDIPTNIGIPENICRKCTAYMNIAYKFRNSCKNSYDTLLKKSENVIIETEQVQEAIATEVVEEDSKPTVSSDIVLEAFQNAFEDCETADDMNSTEFETFLAIPVDANDVEWTIEPMPLEENSSSSSVNETSLQRSSKTESHSNICEICGNIYKSGHALKQHIKWHNNERNWECEICSKKFLTSSGLSSHMRTHTNERPYACSYCAQKFKLSATRNIHERVHTGERPYTCDVCSKSFTYLHVLKNHKLVHTGEKKYVCSPCNRRFTKAHQLKFHCETLQHAAVINDIEHRYNITEENTEDNCMLNEYRSENDNIENNDFL